MVTSVPWLTVGWADPTQVSAFAPKVTVPPLPGVAVGVGVALGVGVGDGAGTDVGDSQLLSLEVRGVWEFASMLRSAWVSP